MKIIVLLLALLIAFGFLIKEYADDAQEISIQQEIKQLDAYPNLLPVVEVIA